VEDRMMTSSVVSELPLRIYEAWEAGRAAWPGVEIAQELFERHVSARLTAPPGDPAELARLHHIDLYLACACLQRIDVALAEFDRAFLVHVPAFVRRVDPSRAFADEVGQRLRTKLFVDEGTRAPRIASYTGQGALVGWLRVAALRTALNLRRDGGGAAHRELDDEQLAAGIGEDADLELIKQRYRDEFQQAIREAFAELPRDQRTVLRLHLGASLTTARIAIMFQVNQSTIVRWMAAARECVRAGTSRRLRERLNVSEEEFRSLMALMLSRLDFSLASSIVEPG
jgi:RNA polymerase sigma-70 factor (ECF subfamily)